MSGETETETGGEKEGSNERKKRPMVMMRKNKEINYFVVSSMTSSSSYRLISTLPRPTIKGGGPALFGTKEPENLVSALPTVCVS